MKRLPLIITIGLFGALAGGYLLYTKVLNKPLVRAWDVVPSEAFFVYEGSSCDECIDELRASSVITLINRAMFPPEEQDSLKKVTDIILGNFKQGSMLSLHITKKDDFDFVFYLPFTAQLKQQFEAFTENLKKEKGANSVRFSDREYGSVKIYEATWNKQTFSWLYIDNTWVGSFTPILIEDVVRTYNQETPSFRKEVAEVAKLPTIKKDGGNIYLDLKKTAQWLSLFSREDQSLLVHQFGQSALLDVKISDNSNFVLNGFCLDSAKNPNYILSTFSSQKPVSFNLKQYVSNRALMFASYGISDGKSFSRDLLNFSERNTSLQDTLKKIQGTYNVKLENLVSTLTGELGVCWMESKGSRLTKVLILNSSDTEEWMNTFNTLSEKLSIDTVFYERFSEYEIRELPLYRFPEKILWPLVSGFNTSYYTRLGKSIIVGDDLEELKRFLEDVDREETWGKSVSQNKFLESTLLESNISLYVNTPRIWGVLESSLHPRWKKFLQENRALIRSIGMGAVQFSHLNDSYYTNISWNYKPGVSQGIAATETRTTNKIITNVNETLSKIFVVKSHISKNEEVLIQDSTQSIRLVSSDGKILWRLPLDGHIAGEIEQVDFFSNGKLQHFFATPGQLHIVDRLGNYVKGFPIQVAEKDIEFVSIVDYDHSKKYRFLVAGKSGKLWMYDKSGVNLEGWMPKDLGESLFAAPRHYRIRGKDYVIAIREDGNAYVMNRRGETLKGFPINLNARPAGDYFLESGNSLKSTTFVVVSRDGFRIKFNLEGKVQLREALVKNTADARFSLVPEKDEKSYLIMRQESRQLTLYDDALKQIVSSDFMGNNPVEAHYLNFGSGKIFIAITDTTQDLSYVFDELGKLLTLVPVESHAIAVRPLDMEKIRIYSIHGKALTIQQF
ncbi:MAG: hypothetical protein ABI477_21325 [Chryseolinea sp.]